MNTNVALLSSFILMILGQYFVRTRLRVIASNIQSILEGSNKRIKFTISPKLSDKIQYLDYFKDKENKLVNEAKLKKYIDKKSREYRLCMWYMTCVLIVTFLLLLFFLMTLIYVLFRKQ